MIKKSLIQKLEHPLSKIPAGEGNEYVSGGGTFKNKFQVTINDLMLLAITTSRRFLLTLQVSEHKADYDVILGQESMRLLELNTDIVEGVITWGKSDTLLVPMVPRDHWTTETGFHPVWITIVQISGRRDVDSTRA